jgi:hypothetical protein
MQGLSFAQYEHTDKMQAFSFALIKTQGYSFVKNKTGLRKDAMKEILKTKCKDTALSNVIYMKWNR